jgi:hydrogenase maturation protease
LIAVIACGNRNRTDDGVGVEVVRRITPRPGVKFFDAATDGLAVLSASRGCKALVLVDACATGAEPGTIFEVPPEVLAATTPPSYTLHGFRWDHALYAGRKMYGAAFPTDVMVLLVETRSVGVGLSLSPQVAAAVDEAVARIERFLDMRAA